MQRPLFRSKFKVIPLRYPLDLLVSHTSWLFNYGSDKITASHSHVTLKLHFYKVQIRIQEAFMQFQTWNNMIKTVSCDSIHGIMSAMLSMHFLKQGTMVPCSELYGNISCFVWNLMKPIQYLDKIYKNVINSYVLC